MSVQQSNETFQRIEKKYILPRPLFDAFYREIQKSMTVDEYGISTICNVYYDTPDYFLIRKSLDKPFYKEKLRIRSYGVPQEEGKAFVEIKKKYDGVVYKRRIELSMQDTRNYVNHGIRPWKENHIQKEIDYFLEYYQPIPRMYIAYERIALFGKEDASLRLTFDFHVRAREEELDLVKGDGGHLILNNDDVLMEIKVPGAYPIWMAKLLDEFQLYPTAFSKYGTAYRQKCAGEFSCQPWYSYETRQERKLS